MKSWPPKPRISVVQYHFAFQVVGLFVHFQLCWYGSNRKSTPLSVSHQPTREKEKKKKGQKWFAQFWKEILKSDSRKDWSSQVCFVYWQKFHMCLLFTRWFHLMNLIKFNFLVSPEIEPRYGRKSICYIPINHTIFIQCVPTLYINFHVVLKCMQIFVCF